MQWARGRATVQHLDRALSSEDTGRRVHRTGAVQREPTPEPLIAGHPDHVTAGVADRSTSCRPLRDDVIPPVVGGTDVNAQVGGETAAAIDAANFLGHRLFIVIGAVLILSFLLLMVVFRSLVLPLKAVIMNLLSVGAAYGVMVAVFQWGWAGSVIGIGEKGPIDPWIPVAMFVVLFGLSMDYEVFLLVAHPRGVAAHG